MKPVEIIPLALKKIKQRKIPVEWVKETVQHPDEVVEGYMNRRIQQKMYSLAGSNKMLRVICDETTKCYWVVTAYLTSRVDRYRRPI